MGDVGLQPCAWWARRRHRRRRCADVEFLWPSLLARAGSEAEARLAWELFLAQEGQAHWHCGCGRPIATLFRTVLFTTGEAGAH